MITHTIILQKKKHTPQGVCLARLKGLEPLTYRLEGGCSIQLSYKRIHIKKPIFMGLLSLERVMGIEPTSPAWKAGILAVEQHPHFFGKKDDTIFLAECQLFFNPFLKNIIDRFRRKYQCF